MKYRCWLRRWIECGCIVLPRLFSVPHKRLRKLVNFSEMIGRKSFRDVDAKRVRIQFLRCISDTRDAHGSILNEAISWIEGNAIFDDVRMRMYVYVITVLANFPDQRIFPKSRRLYLFGSKVVLNTQSSTRPGTKISRFISSYWDMKKFQGYVI